MTILNRFQLILGLMLSSIAFLTCKLTETKPVPAPAGFDWQGHRGCRGLLPENSIPAFLHALEFPQVSTLELDLAVSKDNQLIVSHEPWFNPDICRKPDGDSIKKGEAEKFLIRQMTAEAIRGFDCGSMGNPRFAHQKKMPVYKPTLTEVVEAVRKQYPGKTVRWNIEIKSQPQWDGTATPPVDEFARLVVEALKTLQLDYAQTTVQSFDLRALQAVHRLDPAVRLALLTEPLVDFEKSMSRLGFTPAIYSPYYMSVNKKLVRQCREKGMLLIPWTVNDIPAMRRLIRLGVDGIITDYPDKIAAATGAAR